MVSGALVRTVCRGDQKSLVSDQFGAPTTPQIFVARRERRNGVSP
jgi:hypothetical protein